MILILAMSPILAAIVLVAATGLIVGVVLTLASILMHVPVDPREGKVREVLPGANCGACGYSGCSGYAAALAKGDTSNCSLCAPGGSAVAEKVAALLGLVAEPSKHQLTAVVKCRGTCEHTQKRVHYSGVESCQMAVQLLGGPGQCTEGCLGYGDCARACPYGSIRMQDGVAVVDPRLCRACKICVGVCPKKIIVMLPLDKKNAVNLCSNHEKGGVARKQCQTSCIACGLCAKNCPKSCITITNNNALVDPEICVGCGICVKKCPTTSMEMMPRFAVDILGEVHLEETKQSA
ncbi:MAG: RnfABCDGE type electron transport complex subunit B [Eubacteriales bacterium]|nr:RnfABCDGE type electron transport complex subunit B [Eubacteriales bacterium]